MSDVSGPTPAGSAVTHAPVGVGGKALASGLPTALDNGDVAHVLTDAYGRLRVRLENADGSEWSGGGVDVSGTPSAGNYARWTDADTLEARTTAQVLSDIGAQVAVVGVVDVVTNYVKITTTIPTDGTGDGRYAVRIVGCGAVASDQIVHFSISGGAVSGTAYSSSNGPRLSLSGATAPYIYTGGSFVEIYLNYEGSGNYTFHVEAIGAAFTTGWTITGSGSVAGAQVTHQNIMVNLTAITAVVVGTDPEGSDMLRVGGAGRFEGNLNLGGGDRAILNPTSDGSDTRMIRLCGGGANTTTRGGFIEVDGNEHANTGRVSLVAGNVTGAKVDILTADTSRIAVNHDGTLTFHATTLADLRDQVIRTGHYAVAWTATPATGYLNADGSAVSRATYAALFAVIGTTFGVGDGSTTFNLPDASGLNANDIYLHIKT